MISFIDIYNFLFNYQIHSEFAAFLRILSVGYLLFCLVWFYKDAWAFSSSTGAFGEKDYKNFSRDIYPQFSLFDYFDNQVFAQKFIFITGRNKASINNHFDHAYELESKLDEKNKEKELNFYEKGNIMADKLANLGHKNKDLLLKIV